LAAPDVLEKPLPKPRRDLAGYASVRTLEALLEAVPALEFLEKGYTRNTGRKSVNRVKPMLEEKNKWSPRHEETLQRLRETPKTLQGSRIEAPSTRSLQYQHAPPFQPPVAREPSPAYQKPGYSNNAGNM